MTKDEYWKARVKRNPSFANEDKQIQMSVKMLRSLLEEAYDKGSENTAKIAGKVGDLFKRVQDATGR